LYHSSTKVKLCQKSCCKVKAALVAMFQISITNFTQNHEKLIKIIHKINIHNLLHNSLSVHSLNKCFMAIHIKINTESVKHIFFIKTQYCFSVVAIAGSNTVEGCSAHVIKFINAIVG
jgi:hypothetical protein